MNTFLALQCVPPNLDPSVSSSQLRTSGPLGQRRSVITWYVQTIIRVVQNAHWTKVQPFRYYFGGHKLISPLLYRLPLQDDLLTIDAQS